MTKQKERSLILILGTVAALGPFSIDTYLPGFPAIAEDLNTDIANVSLTLTSYFIGISVGQLIYGPLLDRYGRKKPLLIGLCLYFIAAIGCAFAPDINSLIALRLLQALGGCVGMVASRAVVRDSFPPNESARIFSSLILVMGVAPIVAPTVGGYITALLGWRWIFAILALFSAFLLFLIGKFLSESKVPDKGVSLRPRSVGANYWKVLKNREFLVYALAGSLAMAGMFTYIAGSPFIIMELFGFSEKAYGWIFGANAFGFISGSQINRAVLKKRNSEQITDYSALGLLVVSIILFIGSFFGFLSTALFLILLFLFLFLLGFLNPNSTALALAPFDKNAGVASALIGSIRMSGAALATGLMGAAHNGTTLPMLILMGVYALIVFLLLLFHKYAGEKKLSFSR